MGCVQIEWCECIWRLCCVCMWVWVYMGVYAYGCASIFISVARIHLLALFVCVAIHSGLLNCPSPSPDLAHYLASFSLAHYQAHYQVYLATDCPRTI